MVIGTCKVYLKADWVSSLKEKRMVIKSIIEKVKHKFNVSIAEIEDQDIHKSLVVGFACVTNSSAHADSIICNVVDFIEYTTDAEVLRVVTEIL